MILVICSVRDTAAEVFGRPIVVNTRAQAMRSFTDEANRKEPGNDLANHPDDFILYQLGFFDDNTGEIRTELAQIARAKDVIKEQ